RHSCVPAPYSIYQGILKLRPGTILTLDPDAGEPRLEPYWSAREAAERGRARPFAGSREEAVDALEALLRQAVTGQMIADVPVGAFLSGGIDSSTIVALMQSAGGRTMTRQDTPARSPVTSAPTTPSSSSPGARRWRSFPASPGSIRSRSPT